MSSPDSAPRLREVVFAHDYPFIVGEDGRVFSDRGDWPWRRYLAFAEHLTVVSRTQPLRASTAGLTDVGHERVTFVPIPSLSGPLIQFTNRPTARRRVSAVVRGADAVVARLPSEIGSVAVSAARRLGVPWSVELVTCPWDSLWNFGTWQGRVYAPLAWWKTKRMLRQAPYAHYVTDRFLQGRYPTGGKAAGVSDVELDALEEAVLERRLERVRSKPRPFRLGIIAALSVRFKGVQTALEALGRIRDELPDWQLRILGSGDPEPWRRLAEEHGVGARTHFDGVLPPGRPVLEWLDGVDLYLQPSFQEGLPRSLVEALSRGCPALGSTAGGIPELLLPESLHRPGDAAALAGLVSAAAADSEWQAAAARRNFETAKRYEASALEARRAEFWADFARAASARA